MPISLTTDTWGHLTLIDEHGQRHENVVPVRTFPLTSPDLWIAIRGASGQEILLIKDPAQLPTSVRTVLDAELAARSFSPLIRKIHKITRTETGIIWDVDTDRGRTEITLESEDGIRAVGDKGAVIIDAHGIRYRITELNNLDRNSRRLFERFY